jgi:subtilisin family serine protease
VPRILSFLIIAMTVAPVVGQKAPVSTRCGTENVVVNEMYTDLRLTGCGDAYMDDVLWHLDRADSPTGALDGRVVRPATGRGVVIYVCDTGVKQNHTEFVRPFGSNVVAGIDATAAAGQFPSGCNGPRETLDPCPATTGVLSLFTHGTAVASAAAGRYTGVAPDAQIVSVLALSSKGQDVRLWTEIFAAIIRHAWDPATPPFKTAVINISTGVSTASNDPGLPALFETMRIMTTGVDAQGNPDPSGKRFFFATVAGNVTAGNFQCDENRLTKLEFAKLGPQVDGIMTVGGLARDNSLWSGSCIGDAVEILAPAEQMFVASITGIDHYRSAIPFDLNSGTSYASPYVAGIAATLLEVNPDLTPADIEQRIKSRASHVNDPSETTAGGRVAIYDAESVAAPQPPKRRAIRR